MRILRLIFSGVGITIWVTLVFSLLLWFLGGFLAFGEARPFDSTLGRLVGLGVLWLIALFVILILVLAGEKKDKALAEEIVEAPATAGEENAFVTGELGEMRDKLKAALGKLRKSKFGRRHLYELPWYVIIGPPGAGKTTAIVNSGLNFPLADELGKNALGGVGGTRNCDWWFTEDAVLVDTAGRYTTQESGAEEDNAAWLGFLDILKRYRRRQPINGAIVALSLADLAQQDEATQKAHAQAVRRRLGELHERLGVHFPVYVLFTKADLIAGFTEFFADLGKVQREQVWGFTFPLVSRADAPPIEAFELEFQALLDRLNAHSVERMQAETDPQRRSLIAGFPQQLASMRVTAREFLDELFQESRYEHRQMLRGVYLTSGTQEGTPIDRLLMGMANTFGIGRQAIGTGQGTGRSYFLTGLFERVIFPESGLVSADDRVERRFRWVRRGAIAAAVLAALGTGALWARSYLGNKALIAEVSDQVADYRRAAAAIPSNPVADSDLPLVVPALNILRELPGNTTFGETDMPDGLGWGLYQGRVVGNEAQQTYRSGVNQHFLPRLLLRLEEQMQGSINNPTALYEALKIYLMLGQAGPMNRDLVTEWMTLDWSQAYGGPTRADLRADLATHLDALLSQPMEKVQLNGDLVTYVQDLLRQMPQAQRVYNGIINSPAATELPGWRVSDVGGPALDRAMVRSSGTSLSTPIEGIYTYRGFNEVFLGEALEVASRIQRDSWVLGPEAEAVQSDAALLALSRDVLDLYYLDFVARYDQLLEDLDIVPLGSTAEAAEVANVLSGAASPIVNILNAVANETRLTEERATAAAGTEGLQAGASAVGQLTAQRRMSARSRAFLEAMRAGSAQSGEPMAEPGAYVENRFSWLHQLVEQPGGQPSQLDQMIAILVKVYEDLNRIVYSGDPANATFESVALKEFQNAAEKLPGPIQRWSKQIAVAAGDATAGGTRAGINAAWQSTALDLCTRVTGSGYPFNKNAPSDVAIRDFEQLFAPGGKIDAFFQEHLAAYVDVSARPWTWKQVNNSDLGISDSVLLQMQFASEIRDAFFAGSPNISLSFQIKPEALDPAAESVQLEVDGQIVGYSHREGQPRPVAVTWPGSVGLARVAFQPATQNSASQISREGPWGFFRLLDAAQIRRTDAADRKRVIFSVGGRVAIFQLQSPTVLDPFALPALANFTCPKSF